MKLSLVKYILILPTPIKQMVYSQQGDKNNEKNNVLVSPSISEKAKKLKTSQFLMYESSQTLLNKS